MARKINTQEPRKPRTIVIGAGITEYWYLKHLKKLKGYNYVMKPSLFGDESMRTIQKRITESMNAGSTVVCVFDEDVRQWDDQEGKRMDLIHRKYDHDDNVIIASSMPSIEYWLLLHFENTNRYFGNSAKVMESLRKYLNGFDKKENYLKQERWVTTLLDDDKQSQAYDRAKANARIGQSYTDMWKALDKFTINESCNYRQ